MQVVGIGQFYLTSNVFQIFRAQSAFDGTLRANIHKYRGLDSTVGTGEFAPPRLPLRFFQFKHNSLTLYTWHRQS